MKIKRSLFFFRFKWFWNCFWKLRTRLLFRLAKSPLNPNRIESRGLNLKTTNKKKRKTKTETETEMKTNKNNSNHLTTTTKAKTKTLPYRYNAASNKQQAVHAVIYPSIYICSYRKHILSGKFTHTHTHTPLSSFIK